MLTRCVILYARSSRDEARIKRMPRAQVLFEHLRRRTLRIARGLVDTAVLESGGVNSDLPQHGSSFEERLVNAFRDARDRGHEQILALPIDVPAICETDLMNAFAAVDHSRAALGPSSDGGVYILGIHATLIDKLRAIEWNTENVFAQLRERFPDAGILRSLEDIDSTDDLRRSLNFRVDPSTRAIIASLFGQHPIPAYALPQASLRAIAPRSGRAPPLLASF